jgi:ribosomal protein L22
MPRTVRFNKKKADRKRAINEVFNALMNVEVEDAIEVLEHVTEEFRRAQQEPDALSADAFKHKSSDES